MAGSYGTLAVLAEVTIKVLPRHDESATLAVLGLDDGAAITALADGLNAPHEVSAAAHLPQAAAARAGVSALAAAGASATVLRLEGPESSVAFRMRALRDLFAARGALVELRDAESERLWREIGAVQPLLPNGDRVVWRVSVPPASGPTVTAALARAMDVAGFYDWGGGLLWLAAALNDGDGGAAAIRTALGGRGHATLIRAPEALRADVPVFEPQAAPLAALTRRVKDSFDPKHILNPGRMYRDA
jgi:glycolate oxidase FAD binding subunit